MLMPIWVDEKSEGSFEGCLMILNLNPSNYNSCPKDYLEALNDNIGNAIADGWVVIFAYDDNTEPKIPDEITQMEGTTELRMMFDVCGRRDSDFSLYPDERKAQFKAIEKVMRTHPNIRFRGKFSIGGICSIASQRVMMPITDIG